MAAGSNRKEAPAEPFKRVLGLAVRAIAGDGEIQVSYAPGKPELDGKSVQLPEPSRVPSAAGGGGHPRLGRQPGTDGGLPRRQAACPPRAQGGPCQGGLRGGRAGAHRGAGRQPHAGHGGQPYGPRRGPVRTRALRRDHRAGGRAARGCSRPHRARAADGCRRRRRQPRRWWTSGAPGSRSGQGARFPGSTAWPTTRRRSAACCATCSRRSTSRKSCPKASARKATRTRSSRTAASSRRQDQQEGQDAEDQASDDQRGEGEEGEPVDSAQDADTDQFDADADSDEMADAREPWRPNYQRAR